MSNIPRFTCPQAAPRRLSGPARPAGIALVLVLVFMALATVLIIAFFSSATTEYTSAKSEAAAISAKQLADTAVQAAMGTVREATTLPAPARSNTGAATAPWASQPGMIRTYDPASGNPLKYYKLYSSDNMVLSSPAAGFDSSTDVDPAWDLKPALYTDLNSPITSNTVGSLVFPIIDPRAQTGSASTSVQGFDYSTTSPSNGAPIDGVVTAANGTPSAQRLPMPTKWLYVLADGTLHSAIAGSSNTSVTVNAATPKNPIVGRVAYWTDDETCKININTAAEATNGTTGSTFWDTPHFYSSTDVNFATSQPAQGEFQRYPGHPASVSLGTVFPGLDAPSIFALTPRYTYGGSKDGSVRYDTLTAPINTSFNRLYASLDDLIFDPSRNTGPPPNNGTIIGGQSTTVNMARFFLTASNRSSELNLFGLPRIAMWPIHATNDSTHRTASDQLIAFCSTIPGTVSAPNTPLPFYFTREQSYSATHDLSIDRNVKLMSYLDTLTSQNVPVVNSSFATKYGVNRPQILTEIFDYIRSTNLTDSTLPPSGVYAPPTGDTTINKQGFGAGQATPTYNAANDTQGFGGKFLLPNEAAFQFVAIGQGTTGTGSTATTYPVIAGQAGTAIPPAAPPMWVNTNTPPAGNNAIQGYFMLSFLNPGQTMIGGLTGSTFKAHKEAFYVEIVGLDKVTLNGVPLGFPANGALFLGSTNYYGQFSGTLQSGAQLTNYDPSAMMGERKLTPWSIGNLSVSPRFVFPFYSNWLSLKIPSTDPSTQKMKFSVGGEITVNIYAGGSGLLGTFDCPTPGDLVQTINLKFPDATIPAPVFDNTPIYPVGTPGPPPGPSFTGIGTRANTDRWYPIMDNAPGIGNSPSPSNGGAYATPATLFHAGKDVVRSLVLDKGDVRLLARHVVPDYVFVPHKLASNAANPNDYGNSAVFMADSFRTAVSNTFYPADFNTRTGQLWSGSNANPTAAVPSHIYNMSPPTLSGALADWDNGISNLADGPWINQPDEGNIATVNGTTNYTPYFDSHHDTALSSTFFSPNRMMPSPGMLGSLPTGVKPTGGSNTEQPWQTLLFRPGPPNHPGIGPNTLADHYILDLFWMPSVEPYAISEPFATAGKINLNQQIAPFTYITRNTGLIAALASERVAAVSATTAASYKQSGFAGTSSRFPLNLSSTNGTLRQFKEKFASGDIFRSASQICEVYLVPQVDSNNYQWTSDSIAQTQWYGPDFGLVGDNVRERPYADLYNKITTKSNTYTVHYWAQTLRKSVRSSDPTVFDTSLGDQVVGEQRGATTFERYLDSSSITADPAIQSAGNLTSLEPSYRMRTQSTRVLVP